MPVESALPIARAFAHFLNLANIAEQHHRVRRRRALPARSGAPAAARLDAKRRCRGCSSSGVVADALHDAVCSLRIELVLTAHPTEIMRRTLLQKYNRIADALAELDHADLTRRERETLVDDAAARDHGGVGDRGRAPRAAVAARRSRGRRWPSSSRRSGTRCRATCRALDRALRRATGRGLPLDAAPIRFGSWIGGDRDGNPNVTPEVTRRACLMARWTAADLYAREIEALRVELSMTDASAELRARVGEAPRAVPRAAARVQQRARRATRRGSRRRSRARRTEPTARARRRGRLPGSRRRARREPLRLCHRSLVRHRQRRHRRRPADRRPPPHRGVRR